MRCVSVSGAAAAQAARRGLQQGIEGKQLIDPLTPSDCDLRGLDYMPLFGNHLFGSEFNAKAGDGAWRAAITLWWAAWNQGPAGSLPDDDAALCRLADLGRDVKTWKKLRTEALHGFVQCNDGRLYNKFLCEQALVAWDKRIKERQRKAEYRAKKEAEKVGRDADVPRDKTRTTTGRDADVPADGNRRDGTGRDGTVIKDSVPIGTGGAAADPPTPPPSAELSKSEVWKAAVSLLDGQGMPEPQARAFIGGLKRDLGSDDALEELVRSAVREQPADARAWLIGACQKRASNRSKPAPGRHSGLSKINYSEGVNADGTFA